MPDCALLHHAEPQVLGLREQLRQATRTEHDQLESALDLMRPDFSRAEYGELLAKYHGFYLPFEAFLKEEADSHSSVVQFYSAGPGRWKLPWLQDDLRALDYSDAARHYLISQTCLHSLFPSASCLLGALYVIEGSMLGGMVLSRHFSRTLGLRPESGLRFFSGYGASAKAYWQALLQLLENWPQHERRDEVVLGAQRMFALLQRQLLQPGKR